MLPALAFSEVVNRKCGAKYVCETWDCTERWLHPFAHAATVLRRSPLAAPRPVPLGAEPSERALRDGGNVQEAQGDGD
jgi:hypothetical protein